MGILELHLGRREGLFQGIESQLHDFLVGVLVELLGKPVVDETTEDEGSLGGEVDEV